MSTISGDVKKYLSGLTTKGLTVKPQTTVKAQTIVKPQTTVKAQTIVKPLTSQRTAMPGTSKTAKKNNKSIPTRLPVGSISSKQTVKPVESGIFKLKSNLQGQTRKKPKLLTEMLFRPILDLRTAAIYWKKHADKKQADYDTAHQEYKEYVKENNDENDVIKREDKLFALNKQLFVFLIKRSIALNTYQWAIVKKAIFNKKSISLEELNDSITSISKSDIGSYIEVNNTFETLLEYYHTLVKNYAGNELRLNSDMTSLRKKIGDLILVNDLGKKQVERLLGVAATAMGADAEIAATAAAKALDSQLAYDKTQQISAYEKVNCRDSYTLDEIKGLEKIDPIDRLIDICNTPDIGDNLNLEALRTLDINFKNRRAIHTSDICVLASLKDHLLRTFNDAHLLLFKCRNKINTDGSLGVRGRYRNLDVDAFFRQPSLPFLSIAAYCIMLTINPEMNETKRGYFRMGEPHEVKVSGPEAKEQLVTIYEFTKYLLVSNCGWKDNFLDNGITPPSTAQVFSNNHIGNANRLLCHMLSNVYNMIHLFRTSKKVEKIATYKIRDQPAQVAAGPTLLQRFNPFARRPSAAPAVPLRIQVPMLSPGSPGGGSPVPPPLPPGSPGGGGSPVPPPLPPGSPGGGGSPVPPPAAPPQPAGPPLPDTVAELLRIVQTNPGNAHTVKRAIGHLVTLLDKRPVAEGLNNRIASVRANAPQILVNALNTITNDHELDNIGCRCLSLISMLQPGSEACFDANAQQLLVKVIKRNTTNYNDPISHDVIMNAIYTLRGMVRHNATAEQINLLRSAEVKDALMAARIKDRTLPKKTVNELLTILEYDDNGNNIRPVAQPPPRTVLNRLAFWRGGGGRRKTLKRKSNNKKNSRASRRMMKKNPRATMRHR